MNNSFGGTNMGLTPEQLPTDRQRLDRYVTGLIEEYDEHTTVIMDAERIEVNN